MFRQSTLGLPNDLPRTRKFSMFVVAFAWDLGVIGVGGGANRELELRGSYVEDLVITVYQTPQFV